MTKKNQTSRRHHFVPQGYLKGFAQQGKRIYVIPLDKSRRRFSASVKDVALETDFYTLREPAIFERIDEAERQLSSLESLAIPLIRRIEKGHWRLSRSERVDLSRYIALQATRGPRPREQHEGFLNALEDRKDTFESPEAVKAFADAYPEMNYPDFDAQVVWDNLRDPDHDFKSNLRLQHIQNTFGGAEREIPYIASRQWRFIYFNGAPLITSDSPFFPIQFDREPTVLNSTIQEVPALLFPLSRNVALLMGDRPRFNPFMSRGAREAAMTKAEENANGKYDQGIRGVYAVAQHFNFMTLLFAHRYVYRHPDDSDLTPEVIQENYGSR